MPDPSFDRRALPRGMAIGRTAMADGWTLRRMAWAADPDPDPALRGRLLFLSGRADFGEKYLEAMAHWRARGWDVVSFDWRGQGGSAADASSDAPEPGFALLLDDLAAMIAAEGAAAGRQVVVAHSMGGHLALRLMAERGWRPDAVALTAPMIGIASGPVPARIAALIARGMCALGFARRGVWRSRPGGAMRQATLTGSAERYADEGWWAARNPAYAALAPRWAWLDAAYRSVAALRRAPLETVRVPILILLAGRDRLVSGDAIRAAVARLPRARLIAYPDAAHELLREADPIRIPVLAAIDGFFDDVAPA